MGWEPPWIVPSSELLPLRALTDNGRGKSLGCKVPYAVAQTMYSTEKMFFHRLWHRKIRNKHWEKSKLLEGTFRTLQSERLVWLKTQAWKTIADSRDPVPVIKVYLLTWTFEIGGDSTRKSLDTLLFISYHQEPGASNFKNVIPNQLQ